MSINFGIRQYINPASPAQGTCYKEMITQRYNFEKRGVIEVKLTDKREMCNVIKDPFDFEPTDYYKPDEDDFEDDETSQSLRFINLVDPDSNLDPDELTLYVLVILFSGL